MYPTAVRTNPDIYEVTVPFTNVSTNATNCYIVKEGNKALVIDTGAPCEEGYRVLRDALEHLSIDPKHTSFFLTHLHYDHVGLIDRIASAGAHIYLSGEAVVAARDGGAAELHAGFCRMVQEGVARTEADELVRSVSGPRMIDIDRYVVTAVSDGDTIEVGSHRLMVVGTPGHTPDHLSLYEPNSKTLFGGDHILFVISPGITLFPDGSDSMGIYFDSLNRVRNLDVETLLISHGPNRPDFRERIDWLEQHHRERLSEAVGIITRKPGLSGEEVVRLIRWNVPHEHWSDISLMQRWCIFMGGIAILDHLVHTGRVIRQMTSAHTSAYFPAASNS